MNEAARLLRLFVPGAVFLLLYGVWFVLDSNLGCRSLPRISVGAAALAGGTAIPIGFVAQTIAAEITWCSWLRWRPLRTIDNRAVARLIPDVSEDRLSREELVGIVDVRMHEKYGRDEYPHAMNRVRSLTDLYQGLAHGAVAAFLAPLPMIVTVLVTPGWPGDDPLDRARWALLTVSIAVCAVLVLCMGRSHQRVITITGAMVRDILDPRKLVRS